MVPAVKYYPSSSQLKKQKVAGSNTSSITKSEMLIPNVYHHFFCHIFHHVYLFMENSLFMHIMLCFDQTNSPLTLLNSHRNTHLAMKRSVFVYFLSSLLVVRFVGMCIKIQWTSSLFIDLLMFRWHAFSTFSACSLSQM